MATITIPKKITKGEELIIIPRREYEEFSRWQKLMKPFKKTFTPTKAQKKDIEKARQDYKKGNYFTINELKQKLAIKG